MTIDRFIEGLSRLDAEARALAADGFPKERP